MFPIFRNTIMAKLLVWLTFKHEQKKKYVLICLCFRFLLVYVFVFLFIYLFFLIICSKKEKNEKKSIKKNLSTFFYNSYYKKDSLKIKEITRKTDNFIYILKHRKNYTYYSANLRNKVLISHIFLNTVFKPKSKNQKMSFTKSKS